MKKFLKMTSIAAITAVSFLSVVSPVSAFESNAMELASQLEIPYKKFQLDNGLTVLVHSDHSVPTVYVGMWYGVGSKDEPAGKTGFAHLFEHLMFQGTENRSGEYFDPFISAGATGMNGTTSQDRTNYYATVPTSALDMALWMESDRMTYLLGAIDEDALNEQRGVVKNEKRQNYSLPYAKMWKFVFNGLYPKGHPYHHAPIGSMEDLDAASLEDVHAWFKQYYGASNSVLVLSGDISIEDAKTKVAHYFNEAPTGVPLIKKDTWMHELTSNKLEVQQDNVPQARISRNWVLPPIGQKETTLMSLVAKTLVSNKNAPLRKRLVDDLQWATDVRANAYGQDLSSSFNITVHVKTGVDAKDVERVIDEEIAKYIKNGPDTELLKNSKLFNNVQLISSLESKANIGRLLADSELFTGNPLFFKTELQWQNAASARDLKDVAKNWLEKAYYQLTVEPFPKLKQSSQTVNRNEIPAIGDVTTGVTFPEISESTLENGIKLVVAKHGTLPLVDVSLNFKTGDYADVKGKKGAATMVFSLLDKGTKEHDATALASSMDKIAMQPRIGARDDTSGMSFRVLSTKLEQSLNLAAEMIRTPVFLQDEFDKERQGWNVVLKQMENNPSRNASAYFNKAVFGNHAVNGSIITVDDIESLSRADLLTFYNAEVQPDNMTVYMAGNLSMDEARNLVEQAFGDWKGKAKSNLKRIGKAKPTKPRIILVNKPGALQSTLVAGHALTPWDAADATSYTMLNGILGGGFLGRMNMNLREDKGWAYGARSRINENFSGDQTITVSSDVQIDKTVESMAEILKELKDITSKRPATKEEYSRVVQSRVRALPGSFNSGTAFLRSAISSDKKGLPYDYAAGDSERVKAVSLKELNELASELIKAEQLTWVIVSDLNKVEEQIRALGYGKVEVWDYEGHKIK